VKRTNEVLVGATVVGALSIVVAGSVWLSQLSLGGNEQLVYARLRSIGGLQSGNPVVVRGVRIGRVTGIALAPNSWVIVSLSLKPRAGFTLPSNPAAVIQSTTLFGDWGVGILARADLPTDPEIKKQVDDAARVPRDRYCPQPCLPGATLPDIGQLTAQAGRIAGDIASIASRVEGTFDSTSARRLQGAFLDLSKL